MMLCRLHHRGPEKLRSQKVNAVVRIDYVGGSSHARGASSKLEGQLMCSIARPSDLCFPTLDLEVFTEVEHHSCFLEL